MTLDQIKASESISGNLKLETRNIQLMIFKASIILLFLLLSSLSFAQESCVTTECHPGLQEGSSHPEDTSCSSCHLGNMDTHGSDGKQLKLSEKMCSGCHEAQQGNYPHAHPPVVSGNCYICHDPHRDIEHLLLPEDFSLEQYVKYSEEEYKICFVCHKRDLLMFPDTSFSTDFRDGTKNLHYLHVTKSNRGRNCMVCHAVHGGNQPKIIRETRRFGDWEMNLNFSKTTTGGSCSPGCHRMRSYNR
jgi:predicted CXXCH cytochrome family protein